MSDAWERILADGDLSYARKVLSIHEIRRIITHAEAAFAEREDNKPYDPHGPEVQFLHRWFAENYSAANWADDGCRSENARDLLNKLAKAGFIIIPVLGT